MTTGGVARPILSNISLRVARGELLVVLGENGAGKTTLLKLVARLAIPDRGTVQTEAPVAYCGLGDRSFYYRLSLAENLRFFATLVGLRGENRTARIQDVVDITDIGAMLHQRFSDVSSGIRQRLALARTLLRDPEIIVFDEPTRAIDPYHAQHFRSFLRTTLQQKLQKTMIIATNILEEAHELADRIIMIYDSALYEIPSLDLDLNTWMTSITQREHSAVHASLD